MACSAGHKDCGRPVPGDILFFLSKSLQISLPVHTSLSRKAERASYFFNAISFEFMQAFFSFHCLWRTLFGRWKRLDSVTCLEVVSFISLTKKVFAVHTLPMVDGLMVLEWRYLTAPMMTTYPGLPPYKSGLLLVRLRATGNQSFFESSLCVRPKFNPSSAPNLNLVLWNEKNTSFVSVMFACRRHHHPASHLLHRFTLFWCSGLLTLSVQLLWILKATGWRWTLTSWSDIYQRTIWNLWFWALVRNLQWMCRTDCAWNYFFVGESVHMGRNNRFDK